MQQRVTERSIRLETLSGLLLFTMPCALYNLTTHGNAAPLRRTELRIPVCLLAEPALHSCFRTRQFSSAIPYEACKRFPRASMPHAFARETHAVRARLLPRRNSPNRLRVFVSARSDTRSAARSPPQTGRVLPRPNSLLRRKRDLAFFHAQHARAAANLRRFQQQLHQLGRDFRAARARHAVLPHL